MYALTDPKFTSIIINIPFQLLYFCATEDPLEGFLRALSLVTGITLPTKEEIDALENQESPQQHSLVRMFQRL